MKDKYKNVSKKKLNEKLEELGLELVKASTTSGKAKIKIKKGEVLKGNVNLIKNIKKEIARIKTELNKRKNG